MANVNGLLRSLLGHDHDCACVFLDNTVHMLSAEELRELYADELAHVTRAFNEALEAIREAAVGNAPFLCEHAAVILYPVPSMWALPT